MAEEFFIRVANLDDCGALLECLALAFAPYRQAYTPGAFADTVLDAQTLRHRLNEMTVLVAITTENRLVGTVSYKLQDNGEAHIRGMAVRPDWQGSPVAQRLLARVEWDLRDRGSRAMTLGTTAVLRQAIRFYEKNGFQATGEVSDFFEMDLFSYRKELGDTGVVSSPGVSRSARLSPRFGGSAQGEGGDSRSGNGVSIQPTNSLQSSYDRVADEYAVRFFNELEQKPLERELLDRFAAKVKGRGPACDLGSGPGHVTRYLHERGLDIRGIDLSPGMVQTARRLNPGLKFEEGDMRSLKMADNALAGIVAFYSIIHLRRTDVVAVLEEMKRVLRPGGQLLLSFHIGNNVLHLDELLGVRVSLDFTFFQSDEMKHYLREAGLLVAEAVERAPYPNVEYPSRRAYIFAEKSQ
jgi:SAM-dependent methyltransferase/ribosomal protein S18 acetylase RimI-like enzyme